MMQINKICVWCAWLDTFFDIRRDRSKIAAFGTNNFKIDRNFLNSYRICLDIMIQSCEYSVKNYFITESFFIHISFKKRKLLLREN